MTYNGDLHLPKLNTGTCTLSLPQADDPQLFLVSYTEECGISLRDATQLTFQSCAVWSLSNHHFQATLEHTDKFLPRFYNTSFTQLLYYRFKASKYVY
jgi:hypothetical protein